MRCCSFPAPSIIAIPVLDDVISNDKLRWTLGLGATIGIAVMAIALLPALAQAKLRFRFTPSFRHPAVMSLRSLSVWALGYVVANQVAIIVIRNLVAPWQWRRGRIHEGVHLVRAPPRAAGHVDRDHVPPRAVAVRSSAENAREWSTERRWAFD